MRNVTSGLTISVDEYEEVFGDRQSFLIWDSHKNGVAEILEILSGIIVTADGLLSDKLHLLFMLFDFNNESTISVGDLQVLCSCTLNSVVKIYGNAFGVSSYEVLQVVNAYYKNDIRLAYEDFEKFCFDNEEVLEFLNVINYNRE